MQHAMNATAYGIAKRHESLKSTVLQNQLGTRPGKSLSCDVVFGSPSVGCRGTGICKLNAHDYLKVVADTKKSCRSAAGLLVSYDDGLGMSMILPREFLCANILRNHFRCNMLTIEQPYRLPNSIVTALGLRIKVLEPGFYPVKSLDGCYRIDFR